MNANQGAINGGGGLSNDQLQQLNQRFRCKEDLYTYLDRVLQVYLPKQKNCSVLVSDSLQAKVKLVRLAFKIFFLNF